MRINNNISALNAWRGLTNTDNSLSKSLEKLSSGLRINRAGDDAAGLAISEKMRGQIRGLNQASRNAQDGISLIQTAEGALTETHAILQRMRELTVQSNNSTNTSEDLDEIQKEIEELISEVNRIAEKTEFNTLTLLDGTLGVRAVDGSVAIDDLAKAGITVGVSGVEKGETLTFALDKDNDLITVTGTKSQVSQSFALDPEAVAAGTRLNFDKLGLTLSFSADVDLTSFGSTPIDLEGKTIATSNDPNVNKASIQIGANKGTTLDITIDDMTASSLGLVGVNVTNQTFDNNIDAIDGAIKRVSGQRSQLGAWQNRLEHTIKNLGVASENLAAAESRIRDVDMAAEMMNFTKQNILMQAGTAMLAQANARPQSVLQLLG